MGAIVLGLVVLGLRSPETFRRLMREDGWGEWATFLAFLVAAGLAFHGGIRSREGLLDRLAILGLGIFCLFVAGEEISWGHRLFGFVPPESFLEHNYQQEFEIHNLFRDVIRTKHLVLLAALAYALASLLALARLIPRALAPHNSLTPWLLVVAGVEYTLALARLIPRALAPHISLTPWLLVVAGVEYTYNFESHLPRSGDFAEMLFGLIILADVCMRRGGLDRLAGCRTAVLLSAGVLVSAALIAPTLDAVIYRADPEKMKATRAEVEMLRGDMKREDVLQAKIFGKSWAHKRIFTLVKQGFLRFEDKSEFLEHQRNPAESLPGQGRRDRRGYFMDLWGQPYWIHFRRTGSGRGSVLLYSFGPNRRRDYHSGNRVFEAGRSGHFTADDDIGVLFEVSLRKR